MIPSKQHPTHRYYIHCLQHELTSTPRPTVSLYTHHYSPPHTTITPPTAHLCRCPQKGTEITNSRGSNTAQTDNVYYSTFRRSQLTNKQGVGIRVQGRVGSKPSRTRGTGEGCGVGVVPFVPFFHPGARFPPVLFHNTLPLHLSLIHI